MAADLIIPQTHQGIHTATRRVGHGRYQVGTSGPIYTTEQAIKILEAKSKNTLLEIGARSQAAQDLARIVSENKAQDTKTKHEFTAGQNILKQGENQSMFQQKTNADWNVLTRKLQADKDKPNIVLEEDTPLGKVKRTITESDFNRLTAEKDKQTKLEALQSELGTQENRWFPGGRKISQIQKDIAELQNYKIPDLLGKNELIAPPVIEPSIPSGSVPPQRGFNGTTSWTSDPFQKTTPMGIIGTPERNSFISEGGTMPGQNRAQGIEQGIAWNTPATIPTDISPPDLLSSPSRNSMITMPDTGATPATSNTIQSQPPEASKSNEVSRITKDGKHAIYDSDTKQFLRYAD